MIQLFDEDTVDQDDRLGSATISRPDGAGTAEFREIGAVYTLADRIVPFTIPVTALGPGRGHVPFLWIPQQPNGTTGSAAY
ncbi:hypothetical protein ACFWDQ_34765 [Streptomyces sp. NPDC060053]|uniref:hypothetical protein n=1 Tax=Streptomyces sp. NPDC060053 TaxID=3347047 RepID=UPI0036CCFC0D